MFESVTVLLIEVEFGSLVFEDKGKLNEKNLSKRGIETINST